MAVTKTHPIKSTLKAAIDYICNPDKTDGKLLVSAYGCAAETADIEFAWTRRLQQEGYEIKRGKYISCRTSDQERFTRMKTLGINYTEEAITARIAGAARPSRQPKLRDDRIRLLYDLQSKQGGLRHWVKIQNLKMAAKTFAWLEECGIDNYSDLESKAASITEKRDSSHAEIKTIEARSAELALVMNHAATYRKLKPIYDQYRRSGDKEKFMRGHESEIILFEAVARELKRLGAVPLPTAESMKAELAALNARKEKLLAEYKTARSEAQEYETVKQNVDTLLSVPKDDEPKRTHHIE